MSLRVWIYIIRKLLYWRNLAGLIRFVYRIQNRFALVQILFRNRTCRLGIRIGGADLVFSDAALENLSNLYEIFGKENYRNDVEAETILDMGAFQGYYSMYAYLKYPKATIYAFEPLPENFERLKKNITDNQLDMNRMKIFNSAINDEAGTAVFYVNEEAGMGSSLVFHTGRKIEVPATTIAEIMSENGIKNVDLLKMDIEGAEYRVFRGAGSDVTSRISNIMAEFHPAEGETMQGLVDLIEKGGLILKSIDQSGQIYFFRHNA